MLCAPGAANNERQDVVDSRNIPIRTEDSASPGHETESVEESPHFRVVDRRCFLEGDPTKPITAPAEEKPRYPTYVEELRAQLAETERRVAEKVKRVDQETARTRMRLEADYERKLALSEQALLLPFLEILDNLERAIHAATIVERKQELLEGVRMTADLFRAKLRAHAVEHIEVLDLPFDPNLCQAVGVVPVSDRAKDGIVLEEVLHGYRMGETLLRPAQVRVGRYLHEGRPAGS